jgi:DNA-binding CsgD family transcriptional regulator
MSGTLIGRRDELLAIESFVAAVPEGARALVLSGEAGIGKTSLWRAGLRLSSTQGLRVLESRASEAETQTAFATLGDLFAPVAHETVDLLPPVQREALECALLIRESTGPSPEARVLGLALVRALREIVRERPVLLAVDDSQWVDPSSADVLRFVLRRLTTQPVGVLATVRGNPVEGPFELERAFEGFRRLTVAPLSVGAIHSLLWDRLRLALPRPTLVRVHTVSGGNPFFALELGRGIASGGIRVDADEVSLPDSLQSVVSQRLDALPPAMAPTLVAVAALASPAVSIMEPLGGSTIEDIEAASACDILEYDGDRIRFTHPLLRPACYALLPQHRRRRIHRRLAALDVDLEEQARHLALATVSTSEDVAAILDLAANRAVGRGALLAAAELAERAVSLTPQEAPDDVVRRRVVAARLCADVGDMRTARRLLDAVVTSTAPGAARAEALTQLATVRGQSDGNPVAAELLQRALAEPGIRSQQKATILGALANVASVDGDSEAAARYAEAGLALAETLGDSGILVACLTAFADITFWRTGAMRRDLLDRAIALHDASHGRPSEDPRITLAHNLGRAERFEESRDLWTALISAGLARGDADVAVRLFFLSRMEVGSGRWDQVRQICDQAMELARQTGRDLIEPLCRMVLAEVDAYRGQADPQSLQELIRDSDGLGYGGSAHRLNRAFAALELSRDDPQTAWEQVAPRFDGHGELDEVAAQLAGSVGVEALVGIGDLERADELLARLDHRAATAETALPSLAARCRGLLHEARGDLEAAITALQAAAVVPDPPVGRNPFEQARTLLALGRVHREAQHKRVSRETLEQAVELFDQLGAQAWADKASGELRRIGGRTSSPGVLSETERRIVELVIAGRRNREVAEALFLSPETVAWNLSRVYKKLDVTSRTQLAARLSQSPPS